MVEQHLQSIETLQSLTRHLTEHQEKHKQMSAAGFIHVLETLWMSDESQIPLVDYRETRFWQLGNNAKPTQNILYCRYIYDVDKEQQHSHSNIWHIYKLQSSFNLIKIVWEASQEKRKQKLLCPKTQFCCLLMKPVNKEVKTCFYSS